MTTVVDRKTKWKAFTASLSGTALEWYDFSIYSVSAALIFPLLFFPNSDPLTGTLLAFSTYAVGYVARPLGAIFFGRLGDRLGRKQVLVTTLLVIGIATFCIGLLPAYTTIGVAAPLILVLLRFAQGIGVGGELGVAVLYSNENGDTARRGFWSTAPQMGPPIGNLLANGVLAVLTVVMSEQSFLAWGWRLAFLLSAVLVAFGLWIRLKLEDTPISQALHERGEQPKAPLREVFTTETRGLIAAACSRIGPDITYALFTVFVFTYGTLVIGFSRTEVLTAVLLASALQIVLIPLAGVLSDKIRRRVMFAGAALAAGTWPFFFFPAISGGSTTALTLGVMFGLGLWAFMYGPQGAFITEQFSPRLRATGSSMGFAIGSVFGGAFAPLVFTYLLQQFNSWVPVAIYVATACAITIIGMLLGRDYQEAEDAPYLNRHATSHEETSA